MNTYKYYEPNNLDKGLECSICLEYLINPVLESSCGQMFCRDCLNDAKSVKSICPLCNCNIVEGVVSKYILNKLDDTKVLCTICNEDTPIKRGDYHNIHIIKDCKSEQCQYCSLKFSKSEIFNHINIDCVHSNIIKCKGSIVLCPFQSTREEISIHQESCNYLKLESVLSSLISTNNENLIKINTLESNQITSTQYQQELDEKNRELNSLYQQINAYKDKLEIQQQQLEQLLLQQQQKQELQQHQQQQFSLHQQQKVQQIQQQQQQRQQLLQQQRSSIPSSYSSISSSNSPMSSSYSSIPYSYSTSISSSPSIARQQATQQQQQQQATQQLQQQTALQQEQQQ